MNLCLRAGSAQLSPCVPTKQARLLALGVILESNCQPYTGRFHVNPIHLDLRGAQKSIFQHHDDKLSFLRLLRFFPHPLGQNGLICRCELCNFNLRTSADPWHSMGWRTVHCAQSAIFVRPAFRRRFDGRVVVAQG